MEVTMEKEVKLKTEEEKKAALEAALARVRPVVKANVEKDNSVMGRLSKIANATPEKEQEKAKAKDKKPLSLIDMAKKQADLDKEAKKHGEENPTEKIRNLTFGTYNKKINNPKTECDWLCSSEKDLQVYLNDPLRGGCMSSGLFRELLSGMEYTGDKNNIEKMAKDISILMLSGDKDPVGKETKGVNKVYHLFKKANIQDVTLKYYNNLRHDILHEENKEEIYELIYEWIINHIVETI
jgi:alpha-beta hydrolase superfamily lysophospholipase